MANKWVFQNGILVESVEYNLHTGEPVKPKWTPRGLPCVHLGEATGEILTCNTCGGSRTASIYDCSIYGECTTTSRLFRDGVWDSGTMTLGPRKEVPWCKTCPDYYNANDPVPPPNVQDLVAQAFPQVIIRPHVNQQTFTNCSCCGGVVGITCPCSGKTPADTLTATAIGFNSGHTFFGPGCDGTYTLTRGLQCINGLGGINTDDGWSFFDYANSLIYKIQDPTSGAASGNSISIPINSGLTNGPIIISGVAYPNRDCNVFSGINIDCASFRSSGVHVGICYFVSNSGNLSGLCLINTLCNNVNVSDFAIGTPISCSGTFHVGFSEGISASGQLPCVSGQNFACQIVIDVQGSFA